MILVGLQLFTQNLAHFEKVLLYGIPCQCSWRIPVWARERGEGEGKEEEEEEEASVAAGSVYRPSPSQSQELRSRAVTAQRRSGEKKEALRELPYKKRLFAVVRINERKEVGKEVKCLFWRLVDTSKVGGTTKGRRGGRYIIGEHWLTVGGGKRGGRVFPFLVLNIWGTVVVISLPLLQPGGFLR